MTIFELGALGEFTAAFLLLVSLVYVGLQIKQNTKVARADMTKDLFLASRSAIMEIAGNPELNGLYTEIREFDNPELTRRYTFYASFFRLYELQFNLHGQGLLDENIAQSYTLIVRMFTKTRYFDEYWAIGRQEFQNDFVDYIEEQKAIAPIT